jgi:MFS family permease
VSASAARRLKVRSAFIAATGNFLEMFDFMVYGYYASAISRAYFPTGSEFNSLMAALAAFGAGFLMRPIGALVLGAYIDRHGRRNGLILSLGMMSVGTLTIALLPSYARIGAAAPLAILVGRLIQGLSAGVEVGGVSVYLAEIATPGKRGFYVSWQSASQQAAVAFAAALGLIANLLLSKAQMDDWGWRLPFIVGCTLIPFLFLMRRGLPETAEFQARPEKLGNRAILLLLSSYWRTILLGMMMAVLTTVAFYTITAYAPVYGAGVLHLTATSSFLVTLCVGISNFILLPIMGGLSDKLGRRPMLITASVLAMVTSYPAMMWLVQAPSPGRLLAVELWLSILYSTYNGAMVVFLTEAIPVEARTSGFSIAYSLATAIFGGFTPLACTYLIHATGDKAIPGLWLSAAALSGLIGSAMLRTPMTAATCHCPTNGACSQRAFPAASDRPLSNADSEGTPRT